MVVEQAMVIFKLEKLDQKVLEEVEIMMVDMLNIDLGGGVGGGG